MTNKEKRHELEQTIAVLEAELYRRREQLNTIVIEMALESIHDHNPEESVESRVSKLPLYRH